MKHMPKVLFIDERIQQQSQRVTVKRAPTVVGVVAGFVLLIGISVPGGTVHIVNGILLLFLSQVLRRVSWNSVAETQDDAGLDPKKFAFVRKIAIGVGIFFALLMGVPLVLLMLGVIS